MSNEVSPEQSSWGWKAVIIAIILASVFLAFMFFAVNNEPDYMPSQQKKAAAQASSDSNDMQHDMAEMDHGDMAGMDHGDASMPVHETH